jgi:hypothetical protein
LCPAGSFQISQYGIGYTLQQFSLFGMIQVRATLLFYIPKTNITIDNWLTLHAYLNIPVVLSPALPQKEQFYTSYRVHV